MSSSSASRHSSIQHAAKISCPGPDSLPIVPRDMESHTTSTNSVSICMSGEPVAPCADRTTLSVSYSESTTVPTVVLDTIPPPKPRTRLASLSQRRRGCRCRCLGMAKAISWDGMKERLRRLFSWTLGVVTAMSGAGIRMMKAESLHIVRHVFIVVTISCLVQLLILLRDNPEDIVLPSLGIVTHTAYTVFHNVYFCFLHKRLRLEKCGNTRSETLQVTGTFFTFLALISNSIALGFFASISTTGASSFMVTIRALLLASVVLEALSDGHLLNVACVLLLVLVPILTVIWVSGFGLCYAVRLLVCGKCMNKAAAEAEVRKRAKIGQMLATVAASCHCSGLVCAICLQEMGEGQEVVELDCCATHVFHTKCIHDWVCRANVCPMCRAVVLPAELYCFD